MNEPFAMCRSYMGTWWCEIKFMKWWLSNPIPKLWSSNSNHLKSNSTLYIISTTLGYKEWNRFWTRKLVWALICLPYSYWPMEFWPWHSFGDTWLYLRIWIGLQFMMGLLSLYIFWQVQVKIQITLTRWVSLLMCKNQRYLQFVFKALGY